MLGGALLEELGIKYLAVSLPQHVSTVLTTSDGRRYRQDFTPRKTKLKENYTEIIPDMLENEKERVKIKNKKEGMLIFKKWNPYRFIPYQLNVYVTNPEIGIQNFLLDNTGVFLDMDEKFSLAEKSYQQALKLNSNHSFSYSNLGNFLLNSGRLEEGIEIYQKSLEINPNNLWGYNHLGIALFKLGRYEEAIDTYKKALEIAPNNPDLYYNLGSAL